MEKEHKEPLGPYDLFYPDQIPKPTEDPFHLVDFMMESALLLKARSIMDIGTSTGVIALLLAGRTACTKIIGVEIDPLSAKYAQENVERNGLTSRVTIINDDFRNLTEIPHIIDEGSIDIIVSNPPYVKKGHGRKSLDKRRVVARSEEIGNLKELIKVCATLLSDEGRLFLIMPASRHDELLSELESVDMLPLRVQGLYKDKEGGKEKLFMIEAAKKCWG
jgi:tRNA1(Val) A37 N6-methylase TrmN6